MVVAAEVVLVVVGEEAVTTPLVHQDRETPVINMQKNQHARSVARLVTQHKDAGIVTMMMKSINNKAKLLVLHLPLMALTQIGTSIVGRLTISLEI